MGPLPFYPTDFPALLPHARLQMHDVRAQLVARAPRVVEGVRSGGHPREEPLVQRVLVVRRHARHQPADQLDQRVRQLRVVVAHEQVNQLDRLFFADGQVNPTPDRLIEVRLARPARARRRAIIFSHQ